MESNKRSQFYSVVFTIVLSAFALASFCGNPVHAQNSSKIVEDGSTWVVYEKFELAGSLTIKDGATVKVDGVPTKIKGDTTYSGNIFLSLGKEMD